MELFKHCPQGLCHPENTHFRNRSIFCSTCQRTIYNDINQYLQILNPYQSVCVAQAFAEMTGDLYLRCKIPMENMPYILPQDNAFVRYDVLVQCIRLLSIMNGTFIKYDEQTSEALNTKIIEGFIDRFSRILDEQEETIEDKKVLEMVRYMIKYMQQAAPNCNVIEHFLQVYAPYVKSIDLDPANNSFHVYNTSHLVLEKFRAVNQHANEIRDRYSPASLQFELIYVLVYVYLFSENMDVVVNLVLKFLSQICSGSYFIIPFRDDCYRHLETQLGRVRNGTQLYRRVVALQRQGIRDVISVDLLKDIQELHKIYENGFEAFWCRKRPTPSKEVIEYAISQTFPAILFNSEEHYYGYVMSLPILKQNFNPKAGTFQKNTVSRCKSIVDFTSNFITRFNNFHTNDGEPIVYWTADMFKLFLSSSDQFKDMFEEFYKMFVVPQQEV